MYIAPMTQAWFLARFTDTRHYFVFLSPPRLVPLHFFPLHFFLWNSSFVIFPFLDSSSRPARVSRMIDRSLHWYIQCTAASFLARLAINDRSSECMRRASSGEHGIDPSAASNIPHTRDNFMPLIKMYSLHTRTHVAVPSFFLSAAQEFFFANCELHQQGQTLNYSTSSISSSSSLVAQIGRMFSNRRFLLSLLQP